ncbi:MAG: AAA family ATPase [Gemmatimonadales bacterium]
MWSETQGFRTCDLDGTGGAGQSSAADGAQGTDNPVAALKWIQEREAKGKTDSAYVMKDLHPFIDPKRGRSTVVRQLKDVVQALEPTHSCVILLSGPQLAIPQELDKECVIIDFDLPTVGELTRRFQEMAADYAGVVDVRLKSEEFSELAEAAKGLTIAEAELAFGKAVVDDKILDRADIGHIADEKKQVVRKTGILSFEEPGTMDEVGGLEVLKRWLVKRKGVFTQEARDFGIQPPKGVLLTGIPGCGKSLCARAMASVWELPVLRLDMGSVMAGIVGSSESNMRNATRSAEAMAPCILMVDEIEKGLGGASDGGGDAGTSQRVFGYLLSWMSDKTAPVFVVATANNFERLPPELLRKGRFDEIFFVDFPNAVERRQVFDIHIRKALQRRAGEKTLSAESVSAFLGDFGFDRTFEIKRGTVAGRLETASGTVVQLSQNLTGSEIEEAIKSALIEAFAAEREFGADDVARAIGNTVPLIDTMSDKIHAIRLRALECAVSASAPDAPDTPEQVTPATQVPTRSTPQRGGRVLDI